MIPKFFAFPQGVRRIIYTTNAIEALNFEAAPRRLVDQEAIFPLTTRSDQAAISGLEQRRCGMETTAARKWAEAKTQ